MDYKDIQKLKKDLLVLNSLDREGGILNIYREFMAQKPQSDFFKVGAKGYSEMPENMRNTGHVMISTFAGKLAERVETLARQEVGGGTMQQVLNTYKEQLLDLQKGIGRSQREAASSLGVDAEEILNQFTPVNKLEAMDKRRYYVQTGVEDQQNHSFSPYALVSAADTLQRYMVGSVSDKLKANKAMKDFGFESFENTGKDAERKKGIYDCITAMQEELDSLKALKDAPKDEMASAEYKDILKLPNVARMESNLASYKKALELGWPISDLNLYARMDRYSRQKKFDNDQEMLAIRSILDMPLSQASERSAFVSTFQGLLGHKNDRDANVLKNILEKRKDDILTYEEEQNLDIARKKEIYGIEYYENSKLPVRVEEDPELEEELAGLQNDHAINLDYDQQYRELENEVNGAQGLNAADKVAGGEEEIADPEVENELNHLQELVQNEEANNHVPPQENNENHNDNENENEHPVVNENANPAINENENPVINENRDNNNENGEQNGNADENLNNENNDQINNDNNQINNDGNQNNNNENENNNNEINNNEINNNEHVIENNDNPENNVNNENNENPENNEEIVNNENNDHLNNENHEVVDNGEQNNENENENNENLNNEEIVDNASGENQDHADDQEANEEIKNEEINNNEENDNMGENIEENNNIEGDNNIEENSSNVIENNENNEKQDENLLNNEEQQNSAQNEENNEIENRDSVHNNDNEELQDLNRNSIPVEEEQPFVPKITEEEYEEKDRKIQEKQDDVREMMYLLPGVDVQNKIPRVQNEGSNFNNDWANYRKARTDYNGLTENNTIFEIAEKKDQYLKAAEDLIRKLEEKDAVGNEDVILQIRGYMDAAKERHELFEEHATGFNRHTSLKELGAELQKEKDQNDLDRFGMKVETLKNTMDAVYEEQPQINAENETLNKKEEQPQINVENAPVQQNPAPKKTRYDDLTATSSVAAVELNVPEGSTTQVNTEEPNQTRRTVVQPQNRQFRVESQNRPTTVNTGQVTNTNRQPEAPKAQEEKREAKNVEGWGTNHFFYESKYTKKTNINTLVEQENKDNPKPKSPSYRMDKGPKLSIRGKEQEQNEAENTRKNTVKHF